MKRSEDIVPRVPDVYLQRLETSGLPRNVTRIRRNEGAEMTLTTKALLLMEQRLIAENRVLRAAQENDDLHGEVIAIDELKKTIRGYEDELRRLRQDKEQLSRQVEQATAAPALAVHSEGSQR